LFSLLSADFFANPSDPRKKGLVFRSPIETAQAMVKELKPKADLIILLSHLGYGKDIELVQTVQGIHIIVGGHTGINLIHPTVIKNTLILQTASRGMFGARLDLSFNHLESTYYNSATKTSLENNLNRINQQLNSSEIPEADKAPWRKNKEEIERTLSQMQGKNEFTNTAIPLQELMKDHPEIKRMVEAYKAKNQTTTNPSPSK
jgi:2',3'-cyclic-nucleotide 2'-phosphodiesterase (5'-nucleotidase family)